MSDTRFTLLGIALIFAGFIILGIFGTKYFDASIQSEEFENCFEYFEDRPPVQVECSKQMQEKILFFVLVISLIGSGIISLIKGVRGRWDQDVKPEDMLGPGDPRTSSSSDNNQ